MNFSNTKVIAIDDRLDELRNIVRGLGRAGFSVSPFFLNDGMLEDKPETPIENARIVFTDIHMSMGGRTAVENATHILYCLERIIAPGPFLLIFWTQFPGDADAVYAEICSRAKDAGLSAPIGFSAIDKKEVLAVAGADENFDSEKLRDKILEEVKNFESLLISLLWEERVARAAARTINGLFEQIPYDDANKLKNWGQLMAFLSCEAVGRESALENSGIALDQAIMPLLEDQLSFVKHDWHDEANEVLKKIIENEINSAAVKPPSNVTVSRIQTGYLIDTNILQNVKSWGRGVVSEINEEFTKSFYFVDLFGSDLNKFIDKEFLYKSQEITEDERKEIKLYAVEIGAECDHVQSKIGTQRYLLALVLPQELGYLCRGTTKGSAKRGKPKNESLIDIGNFSINGQELSMLVSCKLFMALGKQKEFGWKPVFRFRRALIEEVAHHYVTHARRPGVMRFA